MAHWRLNSETRQRILWFNVFAALLLIGIGVWFRGLYFPQDFLTVNILVGLLGLAVLPLVLDKGGLSLDFVDISVLALGLCYSVVILTAVSSGDAIEVSMRVWTYVLYYFILSRSLERRTQTRFLSEGLVLIGSVIALWGIMTVPGWVSYSNSWNSVLSSTLQYHNAFASFLVGIMVLTVYFWLESEKFWTACLNGVGLQIMALALAGTQSRGGYLVFLASVVGMFLVYPMGEKRKLWLPVANMFAGFLFWGRFLQAVNGKSSGLAALILLLGFVWALGLTFLKFSWRRVSARFSLQALKWPLAAVVVLVVAAGGWAFLRHGGDVLGTVRRINLQNHSVEERFTFYWDAFRMFWQRPWLGYGGGGWNAAYRGFQSYLYDSTETHSIATQIMVEAGILGIMVFLSLLVALGRSVYLTWQTLRRSPQAKEGTYLLMLALSALAIGVHALIDFDLSEGTVSLILWSNVAALRAFHQQASRQRVSLQNSALGQVVKAKETEMLHDETESKKGKNKHNHNQKQRSNDTAASDKVKSAATAKGGKLVGVKTSAISGQVALIILLLAAAATALLPFAIRSGMASSDSAAQALGQRNYSVALQEAEKATSTFPLEAYPWSQAAEANMYLAMSGSGQGNVRTALLDINRAIALGQDDPTLWRMKAGILVNSGQADGAYAAIQHVIPLAPFLNSSYEAYGAVAMDYVLTLLQHGNKSAAKPVAVSVAGIPQALKAKVDNLNPFFKRNWIVPEKLEATPTIRLQADEAALLLGQRQATQDLKTLVSDKTIGSQAKLWLAAALISQGNSSAAVPLMKGFSPQQSSSIQQLAKQMGVLAGS